MKAYAWLDLSRRKREGEAIDSREIRKHGNDAPRLSQLLSAELRIDLVPVIATDVRAFLEGMAAAPATIPNNYGSGRTVRVRREGREDLPYPREEPSSGIELKLGIAPPPPPTHSEELAAATLI